MVSQTKFNAYKPLNTWFLTKLLQNGILFHKDNFRVEASAFQPQ